MEKTAQSLRDANQDLHTRLVSQINQSTYMYTEMSEIALKLLKLPSSSLPLLPSLSSSLSPSPLSLPSLPPSLPPPPLSLLSYSPPQSKFSSPPPQGTSSEV